MERNKIILLWACQWRQLQRGSWVDGPCHGLLAWNMRR